MRNDVRKRLERLEGRAVDEDATVTFVNIYDGRDGNEQGRTALTYSLRTARNAQQIEH